MPDTIDIYKASDGVEYIVIANEGDDKVRLPIFSCSMPDSVTVPLGHDVHRAA